MNGDTRTPSKPHDVQSVAEAGEISGREDGREIEDEVDSWVG
jgi:hypothetical protein